VSKAKWDLLVQAIANRQEEKQETCADYCEDKAEAACWHGDPEYPGETRAACEKRVAAYCLEHQCVGDR
jgi:hypothetical protein